jgi:hypothetical protein
MVAAVVVDPEGIVSQPSPQDHRPPTLLEHPPAEPASRPPIVEDPAIVELHRAWADLHEPAAAPEAAAVMDRVRQRAEVAARRAAGVATRSERSLIGQLIRANDVLAQRSDELSNRVADLEALTRELVAIVSEELTELRAALHSADERTSAPRRPSADA